MARNGDAFVEAVLAVVADIPPGRVMTYGDVAAVLGSRAARAVGQVMARYGHAVPWWRVVRAGGRPPAGHAERAREHYDAEGVPLRPVDDVDGYRIDLAACRWRG
ncbi:MGMT family protein [Agromyces aurantiacus]|uniref:MGMT family protein n=1 Tax=Agromyces aurantiacus TaxID=165814 RepID=A0ABV9R4N9_9MICO|nr:MGMT family protein [Agromyces aurantiacus]MBM7505598.1 alkylated DNA nucleotide flippase Atl1 [Agromyces aurantiacus]